MRFLVVLALVYLTSAGRPPLGDVQTEYNRFKSKYKYSFNKEEENDRYKQFTANYNTIAAHNSEADKGLHTYYLGVNQFTAMNETEYKLFKGYKPELRKTINTNVYTKTSIAADDDVDWRAMGYVTSIQNQGQCGSCWAFSAVASLEGQHCKNTGQLVKLSEQNLVDCSSAQGNKGCNGGLMDLAFQYINKNNGVDIESSYPYKAVVGICAFDPNKVGATLTGYTDLPRGDEDALKNAVCNIGPISVAIDASKASFQLYSSGVYNETACSSSALDHGVTVVGYGTDSGSTGLDYWLVKNSWGASWGESGYIRMLRNAKNQCGIATMASFPTGVQ